MLLSLFLTITIYGVLVWAIIRIVPLPQQIQQLLVVVLTVALFFYALNTLGIFDLAGAQGVKRVR